MPFHPDRPGHARRPRRDSGPSASTGADARIDADGRQLLYTPAEAAALLRVRESWLRRKAAARAIPTTFLGRHLRFSPADLAAIIAQHARPADARQRRRRSTVRDRDLIPAPDPRVHPSDRDDHIPDVGSSAWPG